jgi:hypothetical protein
LENAFKLTVRSASRCQKADRVRSK